MEQLDYDYTVHAREFAGDENLLVKFFVSAVLDEKETALQGRKIFKDAEFIDIRIPGNKDNVVIRPLRQMDLQRFPKHYAAFKARVSGDVVIGTPLEAWPTPLLTPARIAELRSLNIRTVEQIVAAADSITQSLMGFQSLKQAAQLFVEASKSAAPLADLTTKLTDALLKIEEQGREIARLTALSAETKRK